jgi:hypothetical protein
MNPNNSGLAPACDARPQNVVASNPLRVAVAADRTASSESALNAMTDSSSSSLVSGRSPRAAASLTLSGAFPVLIASKTLFEMIVPSD